MTEQEIKNQILEVLLFKGIFVFPIDSVGIYDPIKKCYRKKNSKFHLRGVSDILGIHRGRFIAIEVKSKTGRPSPEQISFLDQVNSRGGLGIIARSVDDVIQALSTTKESA